MSGGPYHGANLRFVRLTRRVSAKVEDIKIATYNCIDNCSIGKTKPE